MRELALAVRGSQYPGTSNLVLLPRQARGTIRKQPFLQPDGGLCICFRSTSFSSSWLKMNRGSISAVISPSLYIQFFFKCFWLLYVPRNIPRLYARCGPEHISPSRVYVRAPRIAKRVVHHRADLILRRRDGICCRGGGWTLHGPQEPVVLHLITWNQWTYSVRYIGI